MKKIGIITTSQGGGGTYGGNYGAALQGYALVKWLREQGFDAHDINYISSNEYHPETYSLVKRTMKRIRLMFSYKDVCNKLRSICGEKNRTKVREAFTEFVKENDLTYMAGRYYTILELKKMATEFYAFITGSDVVWNPYLHQKKNDEGYFLDFVPQGVKRIAYAPSIGATTLPDESRRNLKELLLKFDALSIREQAGADLVKQETGIDIPVVLDPTMLLESNGYDVMVRKPANMPDKYILVYKFGNLAHTNEKINEIINKLKLPVVYVPSGDFISKEVRYDFGPGEFVWAIRHAELVLSDSFHCSVFAILSKTPFLTFNRSDPNGKSNINSRMTNLLKMTGLTDRMVNVGDEIDYDTLLNVDFSEASRIIFEMRKMSENYLFKALR